MRSSSKVGRVHGRDPRGEAIVGDPDARTQPELIEDRHGALAERVPARAHRQRRVDRVVRPARSDVRAEIDRIGDRAQRVRDGLDRLVLDASSQRHERDRRCLGSRGGRGHACAHACAPRSARARDHHGRPQRAVASCQIAARDDGERGATQRRVDARGTLERELRDVDAGDSHADRSTLLV
jgi:hypothetical protein